MRINQAPTYQIQRPGGPVQVPPAVERRSHQVDPQPPLYTTRLNQASGVRAADVASAELVIEAQAITTNPRHALAVQTFNRIADFDGDPPIIDVYA